MGTSSACPVQGFDPARIPEDMSLRKIVASQLSSTGTITESNYALAGAIPPEHLALVLNQTTREERDELIQILQSQFNQIGIPWAQVVSQIHGQDLVNRLNALLQNHPDADGLQLITYDKFTDSMIAFFKDPVDHTPRLSEPFTMNDLTGWFGLGACEAGDARFALASSLTLTGENITAENGIELSVSSFLNHFAIDKEAYAQAPLEGEPNMTWIGKKFPTDINTLDLEGHPTPLVPEGSTKPIVISVWASWCTPCLHERTLFTEQHSSQYDHVYVSGDQTREEAKAASDRFSLAGEGRDLWISQDVKNSLNINRYPANIIIRPDGTILYANVGSISPVEAQETINAHTP